jgi:hypothetical protein
MVIRKPFKVLVCLLLIGTFFTIGHGYSYAQNTTIPGVDADALSADIELKPPTRTPPPVYRPAPRRPKVKISRYTPYPPTASAYAPTCAPYGGQGQSLLPPIIPPLWGLFSLPGIPFLPISCNTSLRGPAASNSN